MKNYDDILWRNSGLRATLGLGFFSVDARVSIMILPLIFHLSLDSLKLFALSVCIFAGLEYLGYTIPVAILKLRSLIAGKQRFTQDTISNTRRFIHG